TSAAVKSSRPGVMVHLLVRWFQRQVHFGEVATILETHVLLRGEVHEVGEQVGEKDFRGVGREQFIHAHFADGVGDQKLVCAVSAFRVGGFCGRVCSL